MNQRIMNTICMSLFIVGLAMAFVPQVYASFTDADGTHVVPEPASLVLVGLGGLGLSVAKRFHKK